MPTVITIPKPYLRLVKAITENNQTETLAAWNALSYDEQLKAISAIDFHSSCASSLVMKLNAAGHTAVARAVQSRMSPRLPILVRPIPFPKPFPAFSYNIIVCIARCWPWWPWLCCRPKALKDLTDVDDALSPSSGSVLMYDGTQWISSTLSLTDFIETVNSMTLTEDDLLIYSGGAFGPAKLELKKLTDIDDTLNPAQDHMLVHDGTKWISRVPTLDGMQDVSYSSSPVTGNTLIHNGTQFVPGKLSIKQLNEVDPSAALLGGHILIVESGKLTSRAPRLDDNSDVATGMSPRAGQVLVYDGTASVFSPSQLALKDITEVNNSITPASGHMLIHDGTNFKSRAATTADLTDMDSTGVAEGDVLAYESGKYKAKHLYLDSLTDVNAPSPSEGQVLTFQGGTWNPADAPTPSAPVEAESFSLSKAVTQQVETFTVDSGWSSSINDQWQAFTEGIIEGTPVVCNSRVNMTNTIDVTMNAVGIPILPSTEVALSVKLFSEGALQELFTVSKAVTSTIETFTLTSADNSAIAGLDMNAWHVIVEGSIDGTPVISNAKIISTSQIQIIMNAVGVTLLPSSEVNFEITLVTP